MTSYDKQNTLMQKKVIIEPDNLPEDLPNQLEDKVIQPTVVSIFYLCWRWGIDALFSIMGLLVLLILLPFLACIIYLDSPGPIFYKQERVGYQGRKFAMYKFRSMRSDAECVGGPVWGTAGDVRVTRVGRFLRSIHLDELPQVFNIVRGEMSLIGPRPERPEYVAELEKVSSLYLYRLTVKPGLTGWAQVKYGYGQSYRDDLVKLHYDLYYIENRSFVFDLLIIGKTVIEILCHRGDT